MYANNEVNQHSRSPSLAESAVKNIPFHTDAVQAIGASKLILQAQNIDLLLSLSAHKFLGRRLLRVIAAAAVYRCLSSLEGGAQGAVNGAAPKYTRYRRDGGGSSEACENMEESNRNVSAMRDMLINFSFGNPSQPI